MTDINLVADQSHAELLKKHPGVLNTAVGHKIVNGKVTDQPAIIVYVQKKLPLINLKRSQTLPTEIDGIPVDVVELAPTTWKAGKTALSEMLPSEQQKLISGVKLTMDSSGTMTGRISSPKVQSRQSRIVAGNLEADHRYLFQPIQNQQSCGSCTAFDVTGIIEARYYQLFGEKIKLSEQFLFTCSGGKCNEGNYMPATLDKALTGICLEDDLPYAQGGGKDFACREGIKEGWATRAKKIEGWESLTDITRIRQNLVREPLATTMHVHQSFMNYVSGVYTDLGDTDPIIGYHAVGACGISDTVQAYRGRNSWGVNWGEEGYFWIAYGASGFDDEMYRVVPSDKPIPIPPDPDPNPDPQPDPNPWPVPSPCSIARFVSKYSPILPGNPILAVFKRTGRLYYMRPK